MSRGIGLGRIALICLFATCLFSGCASLRNISSDIPAEDPNAGSYLVHMQMPMGGTKTYEGKLIGPVTVQTALEQSGALQKFRSMDIMIVRTLEDSFQPLKMPVEFEPRKDRVRDEQNYAIHPGDQIMIQNRTSSPFQKFAGALIND